MKNAFIDHYAILGVDQTASNAEIKISYRRLMKVHHPDKNPRQTKQQLDYCKAINKAYEVLSDPSQRMQYDREYRDYHRGNSSSHQKKNKDQERTDRESKNKQKSSYNHSQESSKDQKEKAKPKNDRGSTSNNHNQISSSSNHGRYESDHSRRQEERSNNDRKHNNNDRSNYQNRDYSHYQENSRSQDRNNFKNHYEDRYPNFDFHNTYQNGRSSGENSDLYEILGLRKSATKSDIKRAYIKLTERFTPDSGNPEIRRRSAEILKAYVILSDPQLRASYDKGDNNSNQNSCTSGIFAFLDDVNFDNYKNYIWTFIKSVCLGCLGCGLVFYVISKWTVKLFCIIVPPLAKGLFLISKWTVKLICTIVPPLAKGLLVMSIFLGKCIGWSFQNLFRLVLG